MTLAAKSDKMLDKPCILSFFLNFSINSKYHELLCIILFVYVSFLLGGIAQPLTCLTADPGVTSSIPARSHTSVEIDQEIISTVNLLTSVDSRRVFCQFQAKVCARSTG